MSINHAKYAIIKVFEFKKSDKPYEPYNVFQGARMLAND